MARITGIKNPQKKIISEIPAFVKLYDIIFEDGKDLRDLPLASRRQLLSKLDNFYQKEINLGKR